MAPLTQSSSFSQAPGLSSSQFTEKTLFRIRMVTIRQLHIATETQETDLPFKIDGSPFRQVMLVANVLSDDSDSKKLIMDDGTGKITGYREPKARIPTFVNLSYARIVAELRGNNEWRSLQITHVRPVYDGHEIYHHILRAIADTLSLERGSPVYPPSNAEIAAIDVDTLTQDIEQLNISRNAFANCAPSLQHLQQEVILPVHDQHLEASSSRHHISASEQSNQRLLLQQDIINSLLDKEPQDSFSGVHVANFIPDIILKHETITADELNDALEDLLERNLITTVQDDEYFRCL